MAVAGWAAISESPWTAESASSGTVTIAGSAAAEATTVALVAAIGGSGTTAGTPSTSVPALTGSRFENYTWQVGTSRVAWAYELIGPDGTLLATTDDDDARGSDVVKWGAVADPLQFSPLGVSVREAALSFPLSDTSMIPRSRASLLHPEAGNRARMSAGLLTQHGYVWWPQATMRIDETELSSASGVSLELLDASAILRAELTQAFLFTAGEAVEDVVARLIDLVADSSTVYDLAPTGFTTPEGSIPAGDSIIDLIDELLGGCGHELTADHNGVLVSREIPPSTADPQNTWRYGQPDGLPVDDVRRVWTQLEPQGWTVEGGAIDGAEPSVSVTAWDTDPASAGYFSGTGQSVNVPTTSYRFVITQTQARKAAYALLRRNGSGPGIVTIDAPPNPAMRPGDVIDLQVDDLGIDGLFIVRGFSLPMEAGAGQMTIEARALWDPEIDFRAVADPQPGFVISASDDFNRADEDLQYGNWIELGWSWGLVGEAAIQRNQWYWSMALWNTALQSSNHSSTVRITKVPSGSPVGPVVRSDGQFNGYAALVDTDGEISLQSWVGGKVDEQLGSYSLNASAVDRDLTLKAIGQALSVEVDGNEVLSVTDERHLGVYVGMLAFGGPASDAPTVDEWSAAEAS